MTLTGLLLLLWGASLPVTGGRGDATRQPHVQDAGSPVTFVVLGHLRGERDRRANVLLDELLDEVERLDPAFAVLTGDAIWGDPDGALEDLSAVEAEWSRLDSALSRLRVPIFRVPGNHDVSDAATYDLFVRRYGEIPRVVDVDGLRLLLLNTSWQPNHGPAASNGGYQLDPDQLALVESALADGADGRPTFAFMHHIHFWQTAGEAWWTQVHPLLAGGGVRTVFAGDYGPEKFSHDSRDGVEYFQSGIAPPPVLGLLKGHEWNRLLAQQFDNFLEVRVSGSDVDVRVHTVGEVSSGHFTPQRWREVWGTMIRTEPGGFERLAAFLETGKAKLFTAGVLGGALVLGFGLGVLWRRL